MPMNGDYYDVTLKKSHLEWGEHRHSQTRGRMEGEAYLPIPRGAALRFNYFNNNMEDSNSIYYCNSKDGFLENELLKAAGSSKKGDIYAKQFQGNGNLRLLGDWYRDVKAKEGDRVRVYWISSNEIMLEKL